MAAGLRDAHRHLGVLPAHAFYGGPSVNPDVTARATIEELVADLDREGTERALVIPNYGVPDASASFALNDLVVEAAQRDDRIRAGIWVSPRPQDAELCDKALALAGEPGVRVLKISFLLGGHVDDADVTARLDVVFAAAREHGLVVHVHTSPGAASDIDQVGKLVDRYAGVQPDGRAAVPVHLVHFGGGMSGHIKLAGSRFFDWVEQGKEVYTDLSWAIGFAPAWLAREIDRRGIGHDRVLFATDQPWGDFEGELARLGSAVGGPGSDLGRLVFADNFDRLYA